MGGFIVAGTHSGAGKTSITLGIMAYLKAQGLHVQGFKVGPDFIDPGHHKKITNIPSHNLDTWMIKPWCNRALYNFYSKNTDISEIEGVMGIFDGFSPISEIGSTAHLAKVLNLPVVLVVDASSMARSIAALILGFTKFDPDLNIAGIIFNKVGSDAHIDIIKKAIKHYVDIPCFGFFKKQRDIKLSSRHLGLVTAEEDIWDKQKVSHLIEWTQRSITDEFKNFIKANTKKKKKNRTKQLKKTRTKIAIAMDRSFCFYYQNNLDLLKYMGAELTFFSPIKDKNLPKGIKGIYIGGGYPELYLKDLSNNDSMKDEIKRFVEDYGVLYAECGGFMYLMEYISRDENNPQKVVGIFPFKTLLQKRLVSLGYREVEFLENLPIGPKGLVVRGHEFHYSIAEGLKDYPNVYKVKTRDGNLKNSFGVRYKNCVASYIHLHFSSNLLIAKYFVLSCKGI